MIRSVEWNLLGSYAYPWINLWIFLFSLHCKFLKYSVPKKLYYKKENRQLNTLNRKRCNLLFCWWYSYFQTNFLWKGRHHLAKWPEQSHLEVMENNMALNKDKFEYIILYVISIKQIQYSYWVALHMWKNSNTKSQLQLFIGQFLTFETLV